MHKCFPDNVILYILENCVHYGLSFELPFSTILDGWLMLSTTEDVYLGV